MEKMSLSVTVILASKDGPFFRAFSVSAVIRGILRTLMSSAQTFDELENPRQGFIAAPIATRLVRYLTHD